MRLRSPCSILYPTLKKEYWLHSLYLFPGSYPKFESVASPNRLFPCIRILATHRRIRERAGSVRQRRKRCKVSSRIVIVHICLMVRTLLLPTWSCCCSVYAFAYREVEKCLPNLTIIDARWMCQCRLRFALIIQLPLTRRYGGQSSSPGSEKVHCLSLNCNPFHWLT